MTRAKICVCGQMVIAGEPHECEEVAAKKRREQERRYRKRVASGRYKSVWTHLARACIARDGACQDCRSEQDLTCHLDPRFAGDHREATLADVVTLCRRCRGSRDGRRAHTR